MEHLPADAGLRRQRKRGQPGGALQRQSPEEGEGQRGELPVPEEPGVEDAPGEDLPGEADRLSQWSTSPLLIYEWTRRLDDDVRFASRLFIFFVLTLNFEFTFAKEEEVLGLVLSPCVLF